MLNPRISAAILAGKLAGRLSRALGRGGGTTLPGRVALRLAPGLLTTLTQRLPQGTTLVAGTNGKTTTTRMLAACLEAAGRRVLHNRAGANLASGVTSTVLAGASALGQLRADMGLFEVDEAALPQMLSETTPRVVLLHNLFRDQLDRYGEVDTIASHWRTALAQLPATSTVLLNADDPTIAGLSDGLQATVRYYGLEDVRHASESAAHVADAQFCRRCGTRYVYAPRFYAHIGHWHCPGCGATRPQPHYRLEQLETEGAHGSRLVMTSPQGLLELRLPLPGIYNALNALAASSAALVLNTPAPQIAQTIGGFSAAFGRIERVDAGGKPMLITLIKNPVGASETIRMLTPATQPGDALSMLIMINDRHADGTDVSWLWDADFERLAGRTAQIVVSGDRAADMAVRLKYAGVEQERLLVEPNLAQALNQALTATPTGATLYALPTYTAMLDLRAELTRRGWVRPFWEE